MAASIFHVTSRDELERARACGELTAASLSAEGFIHCCFRGQIAGVLERYFRGARSLILLELSSASLPRLVVETPPGAGEAFPHVYGALPLSALRRAFELSGRAGAFELPSELRFEADRERRELAALLEAYAWYDHPEGPQFVETHRDPHRTSGHWLFRPAAISAFHRVLNGEELWIAQRGSLLLHTLDDDGVHAMRTLGLDVSAGEAPVLAVPRGVLQAAELAPGEPFAFGANVCAPGFQFREFELPSRSALLERFPLHRLLVERLTHAP